jgi:hypothetical protein
MKLFCALLITSLLAGPLSAEETPRIQTASPKPEVPLDAGATKTIEDFFAALQKKKIDAAYEQLTKNTKIGEKPEEVMALKTKTEQAIKMFGEIQGAEKLTVNLVGGHLMSATYLSLGKELPLRWRFYFYKSGEAWKLVDLRVDDRLVDLFGETAAPADTRPVNWPRQ